MKPPAVASAITPSPIASAPLPGTAAKLIPRTSVPIITTERIPPRLSTGSVVSFTCAGTKRIAITSAISASGRVITNTDAPVELGQQRSGSQRAKRRDRRPERRPERDRAGPRRPRPERRDQRQRGREGHPRRDPADQPGDEQDLDRGRERGQQAGGDREPDPEDQQPLAPVAVADGAEVEHRGREPQRVADRDQVERGLAGVEGLADVGQSDVGDRQVEVGDRGDQDQRRQHQSLAVGCGPRFLAP